MIKLVIISFIIVLMSSCKNGICDSIPKRFASYEEAARKIEEAKFSFSEEIFTPESSWIYGASFYSCDGTLGFLRIRTDHENYYHQNVPITVWESFKNSDSKGQFYNEELRGNYVLETRN
jgi:KTSC domain